MRITNGIQYWRRPDGNRNDLPAIVYYTSHATRERARSIRTARVTDYDGRAIFYTYAKKCLYRGNFDPPTEGYFFFILSVFSSAFIPSLLRKQVVENSSI